MQEDQRIADKIEIALVLLYNHRKAGLMSLNRLFHSGSAPKHDFNGSLMGKILAIELAPGLTEIATNAARLWMPWKGKTFHRRVDAGVNILSRGSRPLAGILWPFYRDYSAAGPKSYHAFSFRTYIGRSKEDPNLEVLKIDYNIPRNPRLTWRRLLDELVQLENGLYLGKAYFRWWWGSWQRIGFFCLDANPAQQP